MPNLAPIVLFAYNRPTHTSQTLTALAANDGAESSDLIVFCDGPKDDRDCSKVNRVRKIVRNFEGFNSITVFEKETNYGLGTAIPRDISYTFNRYNRVIVLEDDIITSPAFLLFMNRALDWYAEDRRVWHVSGWGYPFPEKDMAKLPQTYFWRGMNCWGWATWADRWASFNKKPQRILNTWPKQAKKRFDLNNSGIFWRQIVANAYGKKSTWAIFWYASIFEHGGLCLNPAISYVKNIGFDGSGQNCGSVQLDQSHLAKTADVMWPPIVAESPAAAAAIQRYYKRRKPNLFQRIGRRLKRKVMQ